jgi:hypothetical protein
MFENIRTFPTSPSDEQLAIILKHWAYARIDNWLDTDFNTPAWWFQVAMVVISLVVWWKLVDRRRLLEITFYGFIIMTVTLWLDQVGYELGLWYYPLDLLPVFPPMTKIDYVMLPVLYALVYQHCTSWRSFLIAMSVLAGLSSFALEPLLAKLGFYVPVKWEYYYGFPVYILIGVGMKMVVEKIKAIMADCQQQV